MLENTRKERDDFLHKAEEDRRYLQTIRFGQERVTQEQLKLSYEHYTKKYDEVISTVSIEFSCYVIAEVGLHAATLTSLH